MTQLLFLVGAIAGIFALIWAAQNAARKRGAAEAERDAEAEAHKTEQEMTDITLQPTSPEETKDRLRKGDF